MDSIEHHRRLLRYDAWANRETLAAIRAMKVPSPRARELLAHIVAAEWLWMCRMKHEPTSMAVWPELTVAASEAELERLERSWPDFLASARCADLARVVSYTNSLGEPWSNSVSDILTHVVMHSGYHRGQIASELARAGEKPAYTDFIHGVRQGLII